LLILNTALLLQGLILSNALRAQKSAEDKGCTIALNNLRSEVIELMNEGLEKNKILNSLVNKIKEDEATSKAHAEAQKCEIEDIRKQLAEAKLKCAIAEADRDASDYLKGKCALGPFLSILVIECQHKWTYVNLCKVMDKVQIK
jgi:hypothetical protein